MGHSFGGILAFTNTLSAAESQEVWDRYAIPAPGNWVIMPASVNRSNANHYRRSPALTDYHEFAGRDHWTCGAPGWEAVADHALSWAEKHARREAPPSR